MLLIILFILFDGHDAFKYVRKNTVQLTKGCDEDSDTEDIRLVHNIQNNGCFDIFEIRILFIVANYFGIDWPNAFKYEKQMKK